MAIFVVQKQFEACDQLLGRYWTHVSSAVTSQRSAELEFTLVPGSHHFSKSGLLIRKVKDPVSYLHWLVWVPLTITSGECFGAIVDGDNRQWLSVPLSVSRKCIVSVAMDMSVEQPYFAVRPR